MVLKDAAGDFQEACWCPWQRAWRSPQGQTWPRQVKSTFKLQRRHASPARSSPYHPSPTAAQLLPQVRAHRWRTTEHCHTHLPPKPKSGTATSPAKRSSIPRAVTIRDLTPTAHQGRIPYQHDACDRCQRVGTKFAALPRPRWALYLRRDDRRAL